MNLNKFWRLYDQFVKSKFKDPQLAMELGDLMIQRNTPHVPSERNEKPVIAYIALKMGKFTFGRVHAGDIILLEEKISYVLVTDTPPRSLHQKDFYQNFQHYAVWLPLFTGPDLVTAVNEWQAPFMEFFQVWAEKVGLVPKVA